MAKKVAVRVNPPSPTPSIKDKMAKKESAGQTNPQQALNQETLNQEIIKQKGK